MRYVIYIYIYNVSRLRVNVNRVDLICVFCVILTDNSTALTGWCIVPFYMRLL